MSLSERTVPVRVPKVGASGSATGARVSLNNGRRSDRSRDHHRDIDDARETQSISPSVTIKVHVPKPPSAKRPDSAGRPRSIASRSGRRGSIQSNPEEIHKLLRQSSTLPKDGLDFNYENLPTPTKLPPTIGRHHTIVPPINHQRPFSGNSSENRDIYLSSEEISGFGEHDDQAILTVHEENTPAGTPRLANPLLTPRYLGDVDSAEGSENIISFTELAVKLPDGRTVKKSFNSKDSLQTVIDFVLGYYNIPLQDYCLRSAVNRTRLKNTDSIMASGIQDRTLVFLENCGN